MRQTIDQVNSREGINFWKDDVMYKPQNAIYQKLANSNYVPYSCIVYLEEGEEVGGKEGRGRNPLHL